MAQTTTSFGRDASRMVPVRGPVTAVLDSLFPGWVMRGRSDGTLTACAVLMICSLVLGGGTRGGFLSDAILELLAVPVLLVTLSGLIGRRAERHQRRPWGAVALCCAVAGLPLIQLMPLPPELWTRLSGHQEIATMFALVGGPLPWMPLSVAPNDTWMSFLSLIPPVAIFLGVIQLDYRARRKLTLVFLGFAGVSVFLGLAQIYQGPSSPWRFFAFTNTSEAVGFFANRNHLAALLYAALVFAAAWAIDLALTITWSEPRHLQPARILGLTLTAMLIVALIAGEAMARSRAGLILTIVALAAVFLLAFSDGRRTTGLTPGKLLFGALMVAVMLAVQFALYRVLDRFTSDPLQDARVVFAHNTFRAALAFLPFGAGFGSFENVYPMFERAADTLPDTYANHAHNDVLEVLMEAGINGAILLGMFLVWVVLRTKTLWRAALPDGAARKGRPKPKPKPIDLLLMRAGTIVVALLLAHSFVDYPLRTGAMMAALALCCGLLVEPSAGPAGHEDAQLLSEEGVARKGTADALRSARHISPSAALPASPRERALSVAQPEQPVGGRWGAGMEWPKEWRKSDAGQRPRDPSGGTKRSS